eukprot:1955180-Heterocapsa_arctica.AAC.1
MLLRLLVAGCTIQYKKRTNSAPTSRFVWYNYGSFSYIESQHSTNQFPLICTFGTRNLAAIGTTANRARSGELAVVPRVLRGRIFAKKSKGNRFGPTLTEPRAPQMTWFGN